uniref:Uncharacterized protein n=1 Tax=Podoviridae sp. ctiuS14 TaxID=2827620 RepID=A0A8S5LMH5_9CAUD|nr:MAG TPA: hypothetical protein [Podoviridae sp. ctiuS14]
MCSSSFAKATTFSYELLIVSYKIRLYHVYFYTRPLPLP